MKEVFVSRSLFRSSFVFSRKRGLLIILVFSISLMATSISWSSPIGSGFVSAGLSQQGNINNAYIGASDYRTYLVGDFNGDGKSDLLVTLRSTDVSQLWLSTGNGFISAGLSQQGNINNAYIGASDPRTYLVGDFNGDGKSDLLVTLRSTDVAQLWLSTGNGFISAGLSQQGNINNAYIGASDPRTYLVGDFNGDGKSDLLVTLRSTDVAQLWLSTGNGFISAGLSQQGNINNAYIGASDPRTYLVGDFNGDGKSDLLVTLRSTDVAQLWLSTGNGFISAGLSQQGNINNAYIGASDPRTYLVGDFNGDGKSDLLVTLRSTDVAQLWLSTGNGFISAGLSQQGNINNAYIGASDPRTYLVGDFNGDGKSDLLVTLRSTDVAQLWLSTGNGFISAGLSQQGNINNAYIGASDPRTYLVGDFNGDGKSDLLVALRSADVAQLWISNP